ncbi:C40 family peptidase [Amycolatopsis anabasis]|uniref:C40 family peptidase n=1 Tax=Amycolatopsis anabasis TaxID=1840409 RepID=UPI00131E461B|nr:C40 family peptidase [Amycolatopsis anabasis]
MEPVSSTSLLSGITTALVAVVAVPVAVASIVVMAVTTAGTVALGGCSGDGGPGGGSQVVDESRVNADQMDIAQTIVTVVQQRHLPRRAAVLAISTALVESGMRNLNYGDRDSLGVFQQRPSQGWGSAEQILNPVYATNTFLDHLVALPGWATMPPGKAQQAVQRSGFPDRYAPREREATAIVGKFWTGPDNPVPVPPAPGGLDNPAQQTSLAATGCSDQGGSNIPRDPGVDPKKLPPDFQPPPDPRQAAAVSYALAQLGKPYVWGGKGPNGFDCSGLTLASWAAAGVGIPAGTTSQVHAGRPVPSLTQVQPGDLLFTAGSLGTARNPRHVGLYAGHNLIVNSYDSSTGVILEPLSAWADKVVAIRRVAEPSTPSPPPQGGSPAA